MFERIKTTEFWLEKLTEWIMDALVGAAFGAGTTFVIGLFSGFAPWQIYAVGGCAVVAVAGLMKAVRYERRREERLRRSDPCDNLRKLLTKRAADLRAAERSKNDRAVERTFLAAIQTVSAALGNAEGKRFAAALAKPLGSPMDGVCYLEGLAARPDLESLVSDSRNE